MDSPLMDDEFAANYMERAVSPQAPKRWLWARVADASPTPQKQVRRAGRPSAGRLLQVVLSSDEISHDAGYRSPRESARPSFLPSARRRARPVPGEVPAAERKQDRPAPLDPVGRRRRSLERRFRGG
jgi:hypothetical protein